jgi:hypothetical protein
MSTRSRSWEDYQRSERERESAQLERWAAKARAAQPAVAAQARVEGRNQSRAEALKVIAICTEYGRPDLITATVGMSPAAARTYVLDAMWGDAFTRARAAPVWMPR